MSHQSIKTKITTAVLSQLPSDSIPLEKVINEWWWTKSTGDNLRLTPKGDMMFRTAEIEYFDLPLTVKHAEWNSFVVECGRKLKCPFFIGVNKNTQKKPESYIRLYDSKIAVLMALYGDIHSYLESIKVRK